MYLGAATSSTSHSACCGSASAVCWQSSAAATSSPDCFEVAATGLPRRRVPLPGRPAPSRIAACERGARRRRSRRHRAGPRAARQHAGRQQRQPAHQVEEAEGGAAQVGGRGVGDHRGQQPLGDAQVQTPERDARPHPAPVAAQASTTSAPISTTSPSTSSRCGAMRSDSRPNG